MSYGAEQFTIFRTDRGTAGVAWSSQGVTLIQLPEATESATVDKILRSRPGAHPSQPQEEIEEVVSRLVAHLSGLPQNFIDISLDMSAVSPFRRKVYSVLRTVKAGNTVSYTELADKVGSPGAARAVGQAMACNPFTIAVPCHRVLAVGRRIGGFSAYGGAQTKVDLLALEGVTLPGSALGLNFEPAEAQEKLREVDSMMGALIDRTGPIRLLVDPLESPFEALIKAIVYQQLTGRAASTIQGRLRKLYGDGEQLPTPEELLATPDDVLRGVGLSRAKAAGLKDLASKTLSGVVPSLRTLKTMDDEQIVERLTTIRGIGRWTVEMLLIFRLGRADVFAIDDYGMRKGLAYLIGRAEALKPKEAAQLSEQWSPFRTAASWYLWRAAELGPGAMAPLTH